MSRGGRALLAALACGPLLASEAPADRRGDLALVRRAIAESRQRVEAYEREQRGLLEVLETLDRTAALLERQVGEARERAERAAVQLLQMEEERAGVAAALERTREDLEKRAVALYRAGELGALRLVFSSSGPREFLSRVYALRRLVAHDAELLERRRRQSASLAEAVVRVREQGQQLADLEAELADRSAELERERGVKRRLVGRLYADRARERAALGELEKAARALEETLESLQETGEGPPVVGPPFVALRRRLPHPVDADILGGFGRVVDERFQTETFQSGVVFAADAGTPVRAVAAGRVRFAGWFRGYGRLVILDHGNDYYTVSGHLAEVAVEVGDSVVPGQTIGLVGETGSLSGPRLYFEIRRGADALDPIDWLESPRTG